MSRRLVFTALLALAVVQLAVPLRMIVKRQATLAHGEVLLMGQQLFRITA